MASIAGGKLSGVISHRVARIRDLIDRKAGTFRVV